MPRAPEQRDPPEPCHAVQRLIQSLSVPRHLDGDPSAAARRFPDLFFDATERWAELTEAFVTEASDDFFKTGFALDYNGRRVEA